MVVVAVVVFGSGSGSGSEIGLQLGRQLEPDSLLSHYALSKESVVQHYTGHFLGFPESIWKGNCFAFSMMFINLTSQEKYRFLHWILMLVCIMLVFLGFS